MIKYKTNMAISIGSISDHTGDSEYWIDDIKKDQMHLNFAKEINEPAKKKNLYVRYKIDVNKDGELKTNQLQ